ncbi:hypothetical protein BCV69DRAFT_281576 [Microstroma glucosiphilum]|uniref:SCP2 domain-containing protein n=1 Tax=Pseudomicrostroma glucosiphilum TaxID=1684307 RepID=A0A316UE10_9BASI|nr:hypothetical protein BCV69DRAFT_281576 [Pseudomicrostroma glucosiphilum]PWN22591.1 hypothetical protein BCV69DRAFT_281576 [Pseudomicrostroma glucosiphilum]
MSSSSSSSSAAQPISKERQRMRSEAEEALAANPDLNCPGFESSRVFALLDKWIRSPPAGVTRKTLLRNVNTVFQFVVLPTEPIDESNPRTRPTKKSSGGALRPALWYVDLKRTAGIAKGHPPKGILGVRKRADVVIECTDRDLLHMAQGQQHPQKLYNVGRIKLKGDIDRALRIATLLNQERSRLFGVPPAPTPSANESLKAPPGGVDGNWQREGNAEAHLDYGSGAPAPVPDRAKL